MEDEEVLSDAAKCLHYAFNQNHNCPEELKEQLNCNYHERVKKIKEEKEMTTKPKRKDEISDKLVCDLEDGNHIKGITERER